MFVKNRVPGDAHGTPKPAKVRVPVFHIPTSLYLPWLAVKGLCKTVKWLVLAMFYAGKHAWATVPLGVLVFLWLGFGWPYAATTALLAAGVITAWWWKHPASFWKWLGWFYLAKWRHHVLYAPLWQATITNLGLAVSFDGQRFYPSIVKVRRDQRGDVVTVRMLPGQHPEDWAKAAPRFAHTFHALACTATVGAKAGQIELRLRHADVLAPVIEQLLVPTRPDVRRLPVALDEDGHVFTISLTGHVFVGGTHRVG